MQDITVGISLLIGQGLLLIGLIYALVLVHRQSRSIKQLRDLQKLHNSADKENE